SARKRGRAPFSTSPAKKEPGPFSLDLEVDGGEMLMVALGPLRFDAQQIIAGLVNHEALARADARLRLQRKGEGAVDDRLLAHGRYRLLPQLPLAHDVIMDASIG